MLMQILSNTPKFVFVLFAFLVWLGIKQMSASTLGLKRAVIMPIAMTALSFLGVTSAFGSAPQALLAWTAAAAVACVVSLHILRNKQISYDADTRIFQMPGSVVPMVLFMGIFFTKYVVGASMGMHPELAQSPNFVWVVSALYGSFTGIFVARAVTLLRIAMRQSSPAIANSAA